jgi:hypothetical protein
MTVVEKIHNDIDSAQIRLLAECKKNVISIEMEEKSSGIIEKAERLKKLGFVNNIEVKNVEKTLEILTLSKKQIEYLEYLTNKYPFHKFITIDEFDKICKKYKLIYASVDNYLKEVPNKNLLEIENGKQLESVDKLGVGYKIEIVNDVVICDKFLKMFNLDENFITDDEVKELHLKYRKSEPKNWYFRDDSSMVFYDAMKETGLNFNIKKYSEINKNGYFIAAPKSHFNLRGLKSQGLGYFLNKTFEVKDPIVFQYCKNKFLRIETKWGLEAEDDNLILPISN